MTSLTCILPLLLVLRLAIAFPSTERHSNETAVDVHTSIVSNVTGTETTSDVSLSKTVTAETEETWNVTATTAEIKNVTAEIRTATAVTSTLKTSTAVGKTSKVTVDETEVETVSYVPVDDTTPQTQPPKPDISGAVLIQYSYLATLLPICIYAIARSL